jgi:protein-S-isoprenylcysteine O-methyltransferase Ste14
MNDAATRMSRPRALADSRDRGYGADAVNSGSTGSPARSTHSKAKRLQPGSIDIPALVLTATIWVYWFAVGAMVVRARRKTRQLAGLVPEQALERRIWVVLVPLIVLWIVLPWLALTRTQALLAPPEFVLRVPPYAALRWVAAVCAVMCLALTAKCWARMGSDWRMAVSETQKSALITDGLFARVRHPIYALQILLMLCSAIIVATVPMLVVAVVHFCLMYLKARNEERHMLKVHGASYEAYLQRTGRFFPRLAAGAG